MQNHYEITSKNKFWNQSVQFLYFYHPVPSNSLKEECRFGLTGLLRRPNKNDKDLIIFCSSLGILCSTVEVNHGDDDANLRCCAREEHEEHCTIGRRHDPVSKGLPPDDKNVVDDDQRCDHQALGLEMFPEEHLATSCKLVAKSLQNSGKEWQWSGKEYQRVPCHGESRGWRKAPVMCRLISHR